MAKKNIVIFLVFLVLAILVYVFLFRKRENKHFVCGVPPSQLRINHPNFNPNKGVFNPPYKWRKRKLNVNFIDTNDYDLMVKTLAVANLWSKSANIKFVLTTDIFDSDIRISFRGNNGYLSAIGNSAEDDIYNAKPTLWLENLDHQSEEEFKRVVLHEFGHAIGLEHELQNPRSPILWDSSAVYKYYMDEYKWDTAMVDNNVFYKLKGIKYTEFDSKSIMIYAVPAFLTKNNKEIHWPKELSNKDKQIISKYYP